MREILMIIGLCALIFALSLQLVELWQECSPKKNKKRRKKTLIFTCTKCGQIADDGDFTDWVCLRCIDEEEKDIGYNTIEGTAHQMLNGSTDCQNNG